jgi:hypothetical protein
MTATDKQFICKLSINGTGDKTSVISKLICRCDGFPGSQQELQKGMIILLDDVESILSEDILVRYFSRDSYSQSGFCC